MAIYRNNGPRPVLPTQNQYRLPNNHHLVVTTEAAILSLSRKGVQSLINSSSGGILAARNAKDGSGDIAIADGQVVIVHSIQKVIGKTFKLHADKGQIRLLEYSSDFKRLYFTTSLHHSILCFSISDENIVSITFPHPSPPTVLTISKNSSILITASAKPVVIYVHNLKCLTAPPMLHPQASSSPVTSGAFHPDRNDVFLLCFLDGTIASYDVSNYFKKDCVEDKQNHFVGLHTCEISYFTRLHRIVNASVESSRTRHPNKRASASKDKLSDDETGSVAYTIAGASFIPGYRSRAVSVGADGKCRLIDFESGGKLLRTWHIGASATCLSIMRLGEIRPALGLLKSHINSPEVKHKDYLIAIGRADGIVMLYDSVGLLLQEWSVSEEKAKVISVDWCLNCTMNDMPERNDYTSEDAIINIPTPEDTIQNNLPRESFGLPNNNSPLLGRIVSASEIGNKGVGSVTVIKRSKDDSAQEKIEVGPSGLLVDLFSSAKRTVRQNQQLRIRPRLSSSTFVKDAQPPENRQSDRSKYNNSDSRANLKPCAELLQGQRHDHGKRGDQRAYPIPGSYFSSESSSDDESDLGVGENVTGNRDEKVNIKELDVPMNRSNYLETSSCSTDPNGPHDIDSSTRSESSLSTSSLREPLDQQRHPQNQKSRVIKDAFPAITSYANDKRTLERPRTHLTSIHSQDDRSDEMKNLPAVSGSLLPRLTAENLLLKQAAVLGTTPGQLSRQAGCGYVAEIPPRLGEITKCAKSEHVVEKQCTDHPDNQSCCIRMDMEMHQLRSSIEALTEKVTDTYDLIRYYTADRSSVTE